MLQRLVRYILQELIRSCPVFFTRSEFRSYGWVLQVPVIVHVCVLLLHHCIMLSGCAAAAAAAAAAVAAGGAIGFFLEFCLYFFELFLCISGREFIWVIEVGGLLQQPLSAHLRASSNEGL